MAVPLGGTPLGEELCTHLREISTPRSLRLARLSVALAVAGLGILIAWEILLLHRLPDAWSLTLFIFFLPSMLWSLGAVGRRLEALLVQDPNLAVPRIRRQRALGVGCTGTSLVALAVGSWVEFYLRAHHPQVDALRVAIYVQLWASFAYLYWIGLLYGDALLHLPRRPPGVSAPG